MELMSALSSQFKEKVKDISKPEYDDYYFTRWLRGVFSVCLVCSLDLKLHSVMG